MTLPFHRQENSRAGETKNPRPRTALLKARQTAKGSESVNRASSPAVGESARKKLQDPAVPFREDESDRPMHIASGQIPQAGLLAQDLLPIRLPIPINRNSGYWTGETIDPLQRRVRVGFSPNFPNACGMGEPYNALLLMYSAALK